jgi:hypothetical protein
LNIAELAHLQRLLDRETQHLAPECASIRKRVIAERARKLHERTGTAPEAARRIVERQYQGILLPSVILPFDDPALGGASVADVLADPERYEGETLADPVEGVGYGVAKAKVLLRPDGTVLIHSFAHGRTVYVLKHDAASVRALLEGTRTDALLDRFAQLVLDADLNDAERIELRNLVHTRIGIGVRIIEQTVRRAQQGRAEAERKRRAAQRTDPRPRIQTPAEDAEFTPHMQKLNDVLGSSRDGEPPTRDIDGYIAKVRKLRVPHMHALTTDSANAEEVADKRLPPPEQLLISRLSEPQLAEFVERYVEHYAEDRNGNERSVRLNSKFVHQYYHRPDDEALPVIAAIATLPLVLADGTMLAQNGLDRGRGIVFRIPEELLDILPRREDCTPEAVAEAMEFLVNTWLCDVATDYAGRCTALVAGLTIIQRSLLDQRPVFSITAGRRGGGKTTLLVMLIMAITGVWPSAAAWSTNEEERRKALAAYLAEGLPALIWDNIRRGTQFACPHIEKACSAKYYSDRRLAVTEIIRVAAATIMFFTGNNIAPRGELTSRTLQVQLEVDRVDPENRPFRHQDPIAWTETHRGPILRALYTILLGNPVLRPGFNSEIPTRFKTWWRLVGSAVEHAAACHVAHCPYEPGALDGALLPTEISFKNLLLLQEEDDEETVGLADALNVTSWLWPEEARFAGATVEKYLKGITEDSPEIDQQRSAILRAFLRIDDPNARGNANACKLTSLAMAISNRLKKYVGMPVPHCGRTLILKKQKDTYTNRLEFFVKVKSEGE